MTFPVIRQVRASVIRGGGADYHDQGERPLDRRPHRDADGRYPEYRQSRRSFGINVLGTLVVEIEAADGTDRLCGHHRRRAGCLSSSRSISLAFSKARDPTEIEKIWDQMYFSTQYYGRKGLVVNAISGVDLALWDLLGKLRGEPVYQMLGGAVRDELQFYATGARPDLAKELGFIGGKMPLAPRPGRR